MPSASNSQASVFEKRTPLAVSAEECWNWHSRSGAFSRLQSPWQDVRLLEEPVAITPGERALLELRAGPIRQRWLAVLAEVEVGRRFVDVQKSGPFRYWRHEHRFEPTSDHTCDLLDRIEYVPPAWMPGPLGRSYVKQQLSRLFDYRHALTASDLRSLGHRKSNGQWRPLKVLVTGGTGMIGTQLRAFLSTRGHDVVALSRRADRSAGVYGWNPSTAEIDDRAVQGVDAVVHLAGANIAGRRWSPRVKAELVASRVKPVEVLRKAFQKTGQAPRVFLTASGAGYYGNGNPEDSDTRFEESTPVGETFLAEICREWEAAAGTFEGLDSRVVAMRLGVVLHPQGGALAKMLPPFLMGIGGPLGSGRQRMPWIAVDDVLEFVEDALLDEGRRGPFNVVAPQLLSNREFSRSLARVLGRPCLFPVPAFVLKMIFGEMADATVLADSPVVPTELQGSLWSWRWPALEPHLRYLLGRGADDGPH